MVVTALGSPKPAMQTVHGYGGMVIADVTSLTLARKAAAAGVDGLACICNGAGGHTGTLSPFAFVSAVREFFVGIVIVGGAICDGWGVAGAIAAGADLVYLGTRFIATDESLADAASTPTSSPTRPRAATTATMSTSPAAGATSGLPGRAWGRSSAWPRWPTWCVSCGLNMNRPARA